jgi:hypothetical protein
MNSDGQEDLTRRIATRLGGLPGVKEVDVSRMPDGLRLRCDSASTRSLVAGAVESLLSAEMGVEPEVGVELIGAPSQPAPGTRARFISLDVHYRNSGQATATAVLEWNGDRHQGESAAEASPAGELRASAMATLGALEEVVGDTGVFNLIGVKELRVFDHDLVAVLLYSPRLPDRRMIGLSIITESRYRSAALAVLNATNRAVGSLGDPGFD